MEPQYNSITILNLTSTIKNNLDDMISTVMVKGQSVPEKVAEKLMS